MDQIELSTSKRESSNIITTSMFHKILLPPSSLNYNIIDNIIEYINNNIVYRTYSVYYILAVDTNTITSKYELPLSKLVNGNIELNLMLDTTLFFVTKDEEIELTIDIINNNNNITIIGYNEYIHCEITNTYNFTLTNNNTTIIFDKSKREVFTNTKCIVIISDIIPNKGNNNLITLGILKE